MLILATGTTILTLREHCCFQIGQLRYCAITFFFSNVICMTSNVSCDVFYCALNICIAIFRDLCTGLPLMTNLIIFFPQIFHFSFYILLFGFYFK